MAPQRLMRVLVGAGCVIFAVSAARATVVHVDDDAAAGGDGATWATAFAHLPDALFAATGDPAVTEIRVAGGLYQPDRDEGGNVELGDRTATFHLLNDLAIRGGYRGLAGGGSPNDRDLVAFETVLTGDLSGDDGPDFLNYGDNSFHVVTAGGTDATAVLDGVTVSHGFAETGDHDWDNDVGKGGGIYNRDGAPTLVNCTIALNWGEGIGGGMFNGPESGPAVGGCTFADNMASFDGGGMFSMQASTPTVLASTFERNLALRGGGGMYVAQDSVAIVANCTFTANTAFIGGGLYIFNSMATVANCDFIGNVATRDGGGMRNDFTMTDTIVINSRFAGNLAAFYGGGLSNRNSGPTLVDCTFEGNAAGFDGGGAHNLNTGFDRSPTFERCGFTSNTADNLGGGMACDGHGATLIDCTFTANHARIAGGMGNEDNADSTLTGCRLTGNTAETLAGGLYNDLSSVLLVGCELIGNVAGTDGGGMYNLEGGADITDCVIADNSATRDGGGICALSGLLNMNDTVFSGNTARKGGGIFSDVGGPWIGGCLFRGNVAGDEGGAVYNSWSSANIVNSMFSGNHANLNGGAVCNVVASRPTIENCTFSGNTAALGGGGLYNSATSEPTLANCILWGDGPDEITGPCTATYSDIQGGWPGDGNIDADPLFFSAYGPDGVPGTQDDNLRFGTGSPCIDAADNTAVPPAVPTDLDGNPRFVDDPATPDTGNGEPPIVDMGCFEYQANAGLPGDLDCDGGVNINDVPLLLQALIDPASFAGCDMDLTDINGDGSTDGLDIQAFLDLLLNP